MDKIPDLYNGVNIDTIPLSIYNELITNSNDRSFRSSKNDKGEFTTVYGEMNKPLFLYFSEEYNFYINMRHYDTFEKILTSGLFYDKDFKNLTIENIYPYYKHYNEGFLKGYFEFENSLNNKSSLFKINNEQLAFKVYSRIKSDRLFKRDGAIRLPVVSVKDIEIDKHILLKDGTKFIYQLLKEDLFQSGFNGGEFYKAWEIILNNPTVFEPIFLANEKKQIKQPKVKTDIINNLNTQLSFLLNNIEADIKQNFLVYNYLVCEDTIKFLDVKRLQIFITQTEIKNDSFLYELCLKCLKIIDLWNVDLIDVPIKNLTDNFHSLKSNGEDYFSTDLDFRAIFLNENKCDDFNTENGKHNFVKTYSFNVYSINEIADKCSLLINYITASFPEIKQKFELNNQKENKSIIKILETETISIKGKTSFDPNHFNKECYNLFIYLVENYNKRGKIKFVNIFYYLKDEVKKDKYSFNFIQNDYTNFINNKYNIEIKKYQKAEFDFDEQKRVLNAHEEQFRSQ
jgi:hypothetical protein